MPCQCWIYLWSIQTKLEQEWEREFNQYQCVLRYYVILSHCNRNWDWTGTGTGNLGNWFPTHSGTYRGTYGVLYSVYSPIAV